MPGNRNNTIDTLRTVSTLMVILLHVSAEYVLHGMKTNTYDLSFWCGNVLDSFTRASVPLFVLISGAFLIGNTESIKDFYRKRTNRILKPLIFWSVLYLTYRLAGTYFIKDLSFSELAMSSLTELPFYHLWYLFMLVGLYVSAPLINAVLLKSSNSDLWKLAWILLAIGMLNNGYNILSGHRPIFLLWFIDYLGYFLLGYLMLKSTKRYSKGLLIAAILVSGTCISILSYFTAKHVGNLYFYSYVSPFVIVGALSMYQLFLQLELKKNLLSNMAHLTLGIYLIHAGLLNFLVIGLKYKSLSFLDEALIGIPIKFMFSLFSALLISMLFFRTNWLKKFI